MATIKIMFIWNICKFDQIKVILIKNMMKVNSKDVEKIKRIAIWSFYIKKLTTSSLYMNSNLANLGIRILLL
jgi:hypothetical protein